MKKIEGFNGRYSVTTCGRVYSHLFGAPKRLKTKINKKNGYEMINLTFNKKCNTRTIHSIMAETYLNLVRNSFNITVNHIDGNKLNNSLHNLELMTRKENIQHAFKNGLYKTSHKVSFLDVDYRSKAEFRRKTKISEKKMHKMIKSGEIKLL